MFKAGGLSLGLVKTQLRTRLALLQHQKYILGAALTHSQPSAMGSRPAAFQFSTGNPKDDKNSPATENKEEIKAPAKRRSSKKSTEAAATADKPVTPVKRMSKKKLEAEKKEAEAKQSGLTEVKLYTLKFNSPILPFAKFPLT